MKIAALFTSVLLLATGAHAAAPAHAASAPSAKSKPAEAPKPQLQEVSYEDLGKYLNQHIVVRTTLHTERSGTLVKYSQTSIDLKLDSGAILGLPRDTIRAAAIPIAPPDPLFPEKK